jgi:serine-type D-Ala-D-Ala carboxypeptidase/endopeptidase
MNKSRLYILIVCSISLLFSSCTREAEIDDNLALKDKIDQLVEPLTYYGSPGAIIIGVYKDGEKSMYSYGDAGLGYGPPQSNTIFEMGSITKTFTAAILSDLIKKNQLELSDRIDPILPTGVATPSYYGQKVTLQELVTHTSGLPREVYNFNLDPDVFWSGFTNEDYYEFLGNISAQAYPFDDYTQGNHIPRIGAKFRYSNIGVALLGHLLELKTSQTYESLLASTICSPLNMPDTKVYTDLSVEQKSRIPKGYNVNQYEQAIPRDMGRQLGAGSILSTMDDMLKYMEANIKVESPVHSILTPCHAEIYSRTAICDDEGQIDETFPYTDANGIGMIWYLSNKEGDIIVQHGGDLNHHCLFKFNKTQKAGVVIMMNSTSSSALHIQDTILDWITN